MRGLKTWACAVVVAATAAPAIAQQTGGGGTGTTGRTGTTTGTGGITSGGTTTSGGTSMSGGTGATTSDGTGAGLPAQVEAPPVITSLTGSTSSSTDPVLGKFYGNPYYQGRDHTLTNVSPGGFGAALYPASGAGRTGATATRTGTSANGRTSSTNMSGILIPLPVQINYAAEVRFASPPVVAGKLQGDLQTVVGTGGLANSKAVQVVVDGNNNVTLRGTVMDDEEARLVEGLVRLTPGVRNISNELTFPVASK